MIWGQVSPSLTRMVNVCCGWTWCIHCLISPVYWETRKRLFKTYATKPFVENVYMPSEHIQNKEIAGREECSPIAYCLKKAEVVIKHYLYTKTWQRKVLFYFLPSILSGWGWTWKCSCLVLYSIAIKYPKYRRGTKFWLTPIAGFTLQDDRIFWNLIFTIPVISSNKRIS